MHDAHDRTKQQAKQSEVVVRKAAGNGDLSSYMGQQIAFNQIVALGALTKTSSGTYVQANGYNEGNVNIGSKS